MTDEKSAEGMDHDTEETSLAAMLAEYGPVIEGVSREEAIAEGDLVDVSTLAREQGFRIPVALTRAAYDAAVKLTPVAERAGNDLTGRLWDVLTMLRIAIRGNGAEARIDVRVAVVTTQIEPSLVSLVSVVGPGDEGEAVITILLPEET